MERTNPYVRLIDVYVLTALWKHGSYDATQRETGVGLAWQDRIIEQVEAWTGFKLFDRSTRGPRALVRVVIPTHSGNAWLAGASMVDSYAKNVERVADGLADVESKRTLRNLTLDHLLTCGNIYTIDEPTQAKMQKWLRFTLMSKSRGEWSPTRAYKTVQPYLLDLISHIRALYGLTNELKRRAE